ncbi:MAG: hypothetical protein WBJ03_05610, partial [Moraxellaceae bacterium]
MRAHKEWLLVLALSTPVLAAEPTAVPLPADVSAASEEQPATPASRLPLDDLRAFVEVFERIRAS